MAGWRHQSSLRSVLLAICALVFAGACVTCVIHASALRLKPTGPGYRTESWHGVITLTRFVPSGPARRGSARRGRALPALPTEPYSYGNRVRDPGVPDTNVTLATSAGGYSLTSGSARPSAVRRKST